VELVVELAVEFEVNAVSKEFVPSETELEVVAFTSSVLLVDGSVALECECEGLGLGLVG